MQLEMRGITMKVTKEEVEDAKATYYAACTAARDAIEKTKTAYETARTAARADVDVAWSKYVKLKEAFDNESNSRTN